jgi:hypothetical protein
MLDMESLADVHTGADIPRHHAKTRPDRVAIQSPLEASAGTAKNRGNRSPRHD